MYQCAATLPLYPICMYNVYIILYTLLVSGMHKFPYTYIYLTLIEGVTSFITFHLQFILWNNLVTQFVER